MKILIIMALAACLPFPGHAQEPRLRIRLYDLARLPPAVLAGATAEATRIFGLAGVDLVWEAGDPDAEEAHTSDQTSHVFVRRNDLRGYLAVRIARGMSGPAPAGALGISLPDAQFGASATVFLDRIENLCESTGHELPIILAHVIAHELGHVLLGTPEHARTGLMRARWGGAELDLAAMGHLGFSARQGTAMREHPSLRTSSRAMLADSR